MGSNNTPWIIDQSNCAVSLGCGAESPDMVSPCYEAATEDIMENRGGYACITLA